jgi:hypothetical protein
VHIAFNGLPLVAAGEPDAALHLRDLLERLPALAPGYRYTLLLPGEATYPSWQGVATMGLERRKGEWGRLWLEQHDLVRAAVAAGADVLYFPYAAAPISSAVPVVAWCGSPGDRPIGGGPAARLRATVAEAGLSGAAGLIHIDDAGPLATSGERRLAVPPMVPRTFGSRATPRDPQVADRYGLPQAYVLSHCGGPGDVGLLLGAWTWVASAVGDTVTLVVLARGSTARQIRSRTKESDLLASVLVLEGVRPEDLPAIYADAEAFLFVGWGPSGEAVRRALASGLAIVGSETPESARVVGTAGYLVPGSDARLLGAACLTLIVETELSERLRDAAKRRGAALTSDEPLRALLAHLELVAGGPRAER